MISLAYLIVFVAFWIYSAFRICGNQDYFADVINFNKFYYFFAGYKDTKLCQSYDLWFYLCYFVSCLSIGLLYSAPVAQIAIIFVCLVALLIVNLILRPWVYFFQFLVEVIAHLFLILTVIILLVIASYDKSGCFTCGSGLIRLLGRRAAGDAVIFDAGETTILR